jgi:hypothetical protein
MAGEWILDFYCKRLRLAVEVDGDIHAHLRAKDARRQRALEAMGIRFLRFWNAEIMDYSDAVVAKITAWVMEHEHEAIPPLRSAEPTPNPSQEGKRFSDPIHNRTSPRDSTGYVVEAGRDRQGLGRRSPRVPASHEVGTNQRRTFPPPKGPRVGSRSPATRRSRS